MFLVDWLFNNQLAIENFVFGAEFVALYHVMEALHSIHYKLRIMGVPLSGWSYVYGENMSVIHNTQRTDSTLRNKSNIIC